MTTDSNIYNAKVSKSWTNWLKQHLHDDTKGRYFAFTLTTNYSDFVLRKKLENHCLDPHHSGTFVFLLPATSASGHKHYHGLIRVPASDATVGVTEVTIEEHGQDKTIHVPWVLRSLLWNSYTINPHSTFGNLHLRHVPTSDGYRVEPLIFNSDIADSVIHYWKKTLDHELRDFSEGAFIPHDVRAAIKVRTGRDPHPRTAGSRTAGVQ